MTDLDTPDPYEEAGKLQKSGPPGKKLVYRSNGEGGVVAVYEDKPEPSRLSGRHKQAVRECPDESIRLASKMFSYDYYQLGQKVTVRHDRGYGYVCLTCSGPDRYETKERQDRGCCHIKRVQMWVSSHSAEVAA